MIALKNLVVILLLMKKIHKMIRSKWLSKLQVLILIMLNGDKHSRSVDFFNVSKYPDATFASTKVKLP